MSDEINHLDFDVGVGFVYCDSRGLVEEGRRVAELYGAKFDRAWECDFGALFSMLLGDLVLGGGAIHGRRPLPTDSVFSKHTRANWAKKVLQVAPEDYDYVPGEHISALACKMAEDRLLRMASSEFSEMVVVIAGNSALREPITRIKNSGVTVLVAYWRHAVDEELFELADGFVPLDMFIEDFSFTGPREKSPFNI